LADPKRVISLLRTSHAGALAAVTAAEARH